MVMELPKAPRPNGLGNQGIGPRHHRFVYKGRCWCRRHLDGYEVSSVLCYLFCAHFELISPILETLLFFMQPSRFVLVLLRLRLRRGLDGLGPLLRFL